MSMDELARLLYACALGGLSVATIKPQWKGFLVALGIVTVVNGITFLYQARKGGQASS